MFQVERRKRIIEYLENHPNASVEKLAQLLAVTPMTIRRDLRSLEEAELISRTFGGAVLKTKLTLEIPYQDKAIRNKAEKERIGAAAAALVADGQTVLLDAGTTMMEIAKGLLARRELTVVTTDVAIAAYLAVNAQFRVLCSGGDVQNITGACIGSQAIRFLAQIHADIAFIGASSLDLEMGLSTPTFEKAELKKEMLRCAERTVLAADSSKFGRRSITKVCNLDAFSLLISDRGLADAITQRLNEMQVKLQLV